MKQLEFQFAKKNLEDRLKEFSQIKDVWKAFNYAKKHAPSVFYDNYYKPKNVKEMKRVLKQVYKEDAPEINKMNAKQTRMVYHTIQKFKNS